MATDFTNGRAGLFRAGATPDGRVRPTPARGVAAAARPSDRLDAGREATVFFVVFVLVGLIVLSLLFMPFMADALDGLRVFAAAVLVAPRDFFDPRCDPRDAGPVDFGSGFARALDGVPGRAFGLRALVFFFCVAMASLLQNVRASDVLPRIVVAFGRKGSALRAFAMKKL